MRFAKFFNAEVLPKAKANGLIFDDANLSKLDIDNELKLINSKMENQMVNDIGIDLLVA